MKLTLNSIIYKLKEFQTRSFIHDRYLDEEYEGIKLYYKTIQQVSNECLYISQISLLKKLGKNVDKHLKYICINDTDEDEKTIRALKLDLILISGVFLPEQILNRTLEIFDEFLRWDKSMHMAALEGAEPQEMVYLSQDMIELPMIIFDASFNVLAYTEHLKSDYEFYNTTVANGYTKSEIILKMKKDHLFEAFDKNEGILVHQAFGSSKRNNIYIKLQSRGSLLGYGCIFEANEKVEQGYVDIMKYFFENLKLYFIQNYQKIRYSNFMYENFLSTIIQNPNMEEEQLIEQISYAEGIKKQGPFILIMLELNSQGEVPLSFVAREVKNIFHDGYPFLYNGKIYVLLQRVDIGADKLFTKSEKERLYIILDNYGFCGYVSKSFHDIREVFQANLLCERTKCLIDMEEVQGQKVFFYDDYQWKHLLNAWSEKLPLELLQKEEYRKLKSYCSSNKNNYMKILSTYLHNQNQATKTGKVLFMHRNTIIYTIKKIEELINVDFDDFKVSQDFCLSFLVDEMLKSQQIDERSLAK